MSDFYVGYLPKAPAGLARFTRRIVFALLVAGIVIATLLVFAQHPFASSAFEFTQPRVFEGTVSLLPYPTLIVDRPTSSHDSMSRSQYVVVAPGKHGATDLLRAFDGKRVQMRGKLIYREDSVVLEVVPDSIQANGEGSPLPIAIDNREVELTGEIVDSKCYSGAMNPGTGKVHRDCAVRCLSGGIPPALVTDSDIYLLSASDGSRLAPNTFLDKVAEPVRVRGRIAHQGDRLILLAESIQRQSH